MKKKIWKRRRKKGSWKFFHVSFYADNTWKWINRLFDKDSLHKAWSDERRSKKEFCPGLNVGR